MDRATGRTDGFGEDGRENGETGSLMDKSFPNFTIRDLTTRAAIWCTIAVMLGLCLLILALWLASEIVSRDLSSAAPTDPYRLDRWRKGERNPGQ